MKKNIINSVQAPEPIGPYSQAVMVEDTLYISGQIAINQSSGDLVNENITLETEQVMKNLGFILTEAGLSYEHVVKCSIFISDMDNFGEINASYGKYFTQNPPARETVEVSRLPKDVNVEISCIAVK
ncbi:RidA family protein [Fulvivirga sp. M361]|uniref:Rid family detoxifying hydrolase n=1 Tax=Fulvivirga sp. M361 TaxID=2594266 RepID=UPI0011799063|nr:Rid family detoxifying hydrolase [Fulvivirga sp. M361]TRX50411.1 RidA family protein [Fulvivirga sp. M361]